MISTFKGTYCRESRANLRRKVVQRGLEILDFIKAAVEPERDVTVIFVTLNFLFSLRKQRSNQIRNCECYAGQYT